MTACPDAELALQVVVNCLAKLGVKLDDFKEKKSHEGKSLLQHAVECWNLAREVLVRLGLDDEKLKRLCFSLCITHDIGKLDPSWQLGGKGGRHASRSGELLSCIKRELSSLLHLPDEYRAVLLFAVKKHHSPFFVKPEESSLGDEVSSFLRIDGELNKHLAINVADVVGVFKLADMVSASGVPAKPVVSQYEWTHVNMGEKIRLEAGRKRAFDLEKYRLQSEIASSSARHLIVAAPTGWGKTALSLLRAGRLAPNKIFYVLPTITAIREFAETLQRVFGPDNVGEYFFFSDVDAILKQEQQEESTFLDFYRYFIPNVMVTTIDQMLMSALQIGKYHLRRFNYRNALFVFDEFHLFTPKMIGALNAFFEEFARIYNFSVLMMSATPNATHIEKLKETLEEQGGVRCEILRQEYEKLKRHKVECLDKSAVEFVSETDLSDRRVLFILNTVDRAIQVYDLVREKARGRRVHLIHGHFAYGDRMAKEEELQDAEILVSTQVAEVSLDVSYDVLVTECAPMPSLIQRFGRVNRYGEKSPDETNVYICRPENEKPYMYVEYIATREILHGLEEDLPCRGERFYLEILDHYYRQLMTNYSDEVKKAHREVKKELERKDYFFCFDPSSKNISEILGRELNCLAVPNCYRDKVKCLKKKMRDATYEERKKILAYVKKYFIPVPHYIVVNDGEYDAELGLHVVGLKKYAYDPHKGLHKVDV